MVQTNIGNPHQLGYVRGKIKQLQKRGYRSSTEKQMVIIKQQSFHLFKFALHVLYNLKE